MKIPLSTGFSVEVRPTPLLGLNDAMERVSAEQEAKMPERPVWKDVKSATGLIDVPYSPPPPGKEPTPDQPREHEMYQQWLRYVRERRRVEAELETRMRRVQLRYALTHSVSGVRVPARKRTGLGWLVWFPLYLLDVVLALLSRQPRPPSDWEAKAQYFGLDWDNEIERRLAYFYSVVIGAALDTNLILAAATLMGPPDEEVKRAKRLFPHQVGDERPEEAPGGVEGAGAGRADELQPVAALDEGGPHQRPESDGVP